MTPHASLRASSLLLFLLLPAAPLAGQEGDPAAPATAAVPPEDAAGSRRTAAYEPPPARDHDFALTIGNVMRGPELVGESPVGVRWTDDSRWIYFRWRPGGGEWHEDRELYRVPAEGGEPELLEEERADSLEVLFAEGAVSPDGRRRVSEVEGDLYLVDRRDMAVTRLTETVAEEGAPVFSTDGGRVFFRRGDDLYSLDLGAGAVRQLTDIREGPEPEDEDEEEAEGQEGFLEEQQRELFEHIRVERREEEEREAREEREERERPATLWLGERERVDDLEASPAGTHLLVTLETRPRGTTSTVVPEWVTESGYTEPREVRTKVGDERELVRIALMETGTGEVRWLDLAPGREAMPGTGAEETPRAGEEGGTEAEEAAGDTTPPGARPAAFGMVRTVGWNDAGTHALLFAVDPDWKEWRLYAVGPGGQAPVLVASQRDSAWVDGPCFASCIGWLPDDAPAAADGPRAWYASEATGWAHLYAVDADGSDRERLTEGEWEVQDAEIPESGDRFLLHTSEASPFDRHPWRMGLDGSGREPLFRGEGFYDATPSPDGSRLAVVHSRANRPPELHVAHAAGDAGSRELERVTTSPTGAWRSFPWIRPGIVRFEARDGVRVPARIYRPADLGAEPNGGGVVFVHGAGYLHNVHNGWSSYFREYMFHHLLAAQGYTVLDIDYRGSAGYGRDWRTAVYRHMGGQDLDDQVDGARWLARSEDVDPDRIGIYGGSYGGFITLMALFTEPETFLAGAALRSVTDWAHYNHWYTSRILNLPHEDEEAYRRSSPIYFAEDFRGHLLMAHGMVDTNVHFSDVVRLAQRLIELGKENWEMAVYPVEEHGFVEPSSWTDEYRRIFELFERTIGRAGRPPGAAATGG